MLAEKVNGALGMQGSVPKSIKDLKKHRNGQRYQYYISVAPMLHR